MNNTPDEEKLKNQIEEKTQILKATMKQCNYDPTHPKVLEISQELDYLIVQWHRLTKLNRK